VAREGGVAFAAEDAVDVGLAVSDFSCVSHLEWLRILGEDIDLGVLPRDVADAAAGDGADEGDDRASLCAVFRQLGRGSLYAFAGSPLPHVASSIMADFKPISLVLRHHADALIIEVSDPNSAPPVPGDPAANTESGRGLMLVQALSKEWDFYLPPAGGKTVYCVISAPRRPINDRQG
jgi:hypothetical protein